MTSTVLHAAGRSLVQRERLKALSLDDAPRASWRPRLGNRLGDPFKLNVPVLVVDDEPANLLAMEAVLAGARIEFVGVASGADALRCLLKRDFALILLRFLQDLGCDQIQGEWISMPLPADPCAAFIRSRQGL